MGLPKIEYPTFDLTLPFSNKVVRLRPFLVKEEKILLVALQGEDSEEIFNSIIQVINNCLITENVDVLDLPTVDLEYMFIKLRARSVNNIISISYRDLEDEKRYDVEINLDEVKVISDPNFNDMVEVTDKIKIKLKPPRSNIATNIKDVTNETDLFFGILRNCIETIQDGDQIHYAADSTAEELEEFIQSFDVKTFAKIQQYFASMPHLHYEVKYTNSLGTERTIVLNTLNDFFTLG